jgi:hypothetical protein
MTPTHKQLKLAAKAAGIIIHHWSEHTGTPFVVYSEHEFHAWQPVTNKSDSRDLEVACEIEINFGLRGVWATVEDERRGSKVQFYSDHNNDKGLATCAAVFLCAVEVGRAM